MHIICFIVVVISSSKPEMFVLTPQACHIATESRSHPIYQHVTKREELEDGRGWCVQWLKHRLSGTWGTPQEGMLLMLEVNRK